jgi:hypothetical protein
MGAGRFARVEVLMETFRGGDHRLIASAVEKR